jgi:SulP family sulfate permease
MIQSIQQQWFSNIRGDVRAGLVVALALSPEAIAFSIIAGVDPKIGLYASFSMAVVIAFTGGRPAMISAATAATALLMITLVKDHGLQYLLATTILAGILQILAGYLKLGSLMRFVSRSVVLGFVNALAILIFLAQLPHLINVTWYVYALVAAGLGIIYLFPYIPVIGKLLPSPLICIVALTIFNVLAGWHVSNVGDMGQLPDTLPFFLIPDIPLTFETLQIIFPYAMSIAAVGLLESLMIATIIDDMTDTESDKNRECKGQGTANIVTGFLGGMAGCAMIGQSVINVKSGGYTRLSTFLAGFFLLIMVVFLGDLIGIIPMAALVAVMIMVSISTFNWQSITKMREYPLSSNLVMLATVAIVVYTHNLALGVLIGVLMAALFFAHKIAHFMVVNVQQEQTDDLTHYQVIGQVFSLLPISLPRHLICKKLRLECTLMSHMRIFGM